MNNARLESFSRNASDLFKIAVNVAGFDAGVLMREIHRRSRHRKAERVNETTVLNAMQRVKSLVESPEPTDFYARQRQSQQRRAIGL